MRAVIYICVIKNMDRQQRRKRGVQWLYEAVAAYGMGDLHEENCPVQRTEKGKPYFAARPEIHFSISHSHEYWACAVADQPVGLDLQYHKQGRLDNIAERFFHPREAAWLRSQGLGPLAQESWQENQAARRAFFDVWTAKESYVKWTGRGIDRHFRRFSVVDEDGLLNHGGGAYYWRQTVAKGYSLCLCGGEPWEEVRIIDKE